MSVNVGEGHKAQGKAEGQSFRSIADWEMGRDGKKEAYSAWEAHSGLSGSPLPLIRECCYFFKYQTISPCQWIGKMS